MKKRNRKGFLLIELIVAVSILSIGLVLILRSLLSVSAASGIIADKIASLELIEMRLAQAEELAEEGNLKDGGESIEVLMGERKAEVELQIAPAESDEDQEEVKAVGATVSWQSGGRRLDEKLETYIINNKKPDA